ncbi:MAG: FecR/PupR family sigma factor regulator, partial [Gluconacetobacter sp.]
MRRFGIGHIEGAGRWNGRHPARRHAGRLGVWGRGASPGRMPRSIALSDEAIAWLTTLRSGRATGEDRRAYGAWRARSPAHEDAARQAEALFGAIGETSVATDYRTMGMALASPPYRQRGRPRGPGAGGGPQGGRGGGWGGGAGRRWGGPNPG